MAGITSDTKLQLDALPTLLDLMTMKGTDGEPLRIVQTIAASNYKIFGMCLLQDKNGLTVDLIEKDHISKGSESVTQAILQKWLTSDAPTRTYQYLIECLRRSELGALAELIQDTTKQGIQPMSAVQGQASIELSSTTDAQQTTKLESDPYASYLRSIYTSMSHSQTSQHWSHLPRCEFVQLAMIGSKDIRRGDREEEIIRLAQQGRIETVMSYKEPIVLNNIFSTMQPLVVLPPPPHTRIILIEGAPGGGKSTLALHLCHKWAQENHSMERFDLVVLVYLRDAAYHISHMDSSEQLEVFKQMFGSSRFQAVLHYFSGFTKLTNPAIRDFIYTYSQQQSNFSDILSLLHCFFEAQEPSLCKLVEFQLTQNNLIYLTYDFSPVDYLAIGYYITSLLSTSSSDAPSIQVKIEKTDMHRLKLLLFELSKYPRKNYIAVSPTRKLEIMLNLGSAVTDEGAKLMIAFIKQSSVIDNLTIDFYYDCLEELLTALQTNRYITKILLSGFFREDDANQNGLAFSKMPQMITHLSLSQMTLFNLEINFFFEGLQLNHTLTHLCLNTLEGSFRSVSHQLTAMLQVNRTLKSLDLSDNTCNCNEVCCSVFQGLQYNTSLVHLNLSKMHLSSEDNILKELAAMLRVNRTLKELNLSINNYFLNQGAFYIFQGLQQNTALVTLNLSSTGLIATKDAAQALTTMLRVNKTLTHLDLSKNTRMQAYCIFLGLQNNTTLVHLNVMDTTLIPTKATAKMLIKKIQDTTILSLSNPNPNSFRWWTLSNPEVDHIHNKCDHLPNSALSHLNLSNTGLTLAFQDTSKAFISMLLDYTKLKYLNISGNYSSDLGDCSVFQCVELNTTLLHLKICEGSGIFDNDTEYIHSALALTKMLQVNKTLTHLELSNKWELNACCVFQGLLFNNTIVYLDLSNVSLVGTAQALFKMLKVNNTLKHLNLSRSQSPVEDKYFLDTQGFQHNTTLVHLYLKSTGISDEGAKNIAQALLNSNCSLQTLDISHNSITDAGFAHIAKSLETNTSLKTLDISNNECTYIGETVKNVQRTVLIRGLTIIANAGW